MNENTQLLSARVRSAARPVSSAQSQVATSLMKATTVDSEISLGMLCLSLAESGHKMGNAAACREAVARGLAACHRLEQFVPDVEVGQREPFRSTLHSLRSALNLLLKNC